jgi:hypothetical protein
MRREGGILRIRQIESVSCSWPHFEKNILVGKTLYDLGHSSAPSSHKGVIPKVRVLFAVQRYCEWKPGIHSQVDLSLRERPVYDSFFLYAPCRPYR